MTSEGSFQPKPFCGLAADRTVLYFCGFLGVAMLSPFGKTFQVLNIPVKLRLKWQGVSSALSVHHVLELRLVFQTVLRSTLAERDRRPQLYPDCK